MSKRLQVLLPETELLEIREASAAYEQTVAEWVRECIRQRLDERRDSSPEKQVAAILKFASHLGPTGEINTILHEIEKGRGE